MNLKHQSFVMFLCYAEGLSSSETDVERGLVRSVLGVKVRASTLVPNGTVYAIDACVVAVVLVRRDVVVEGLG